MTDAAFCDRLAVAGFRLFLHGHVHEAKTSNYRYDMTKDGRNLTKFVREPSAHRLENW